MDSDQREIRDAVIKLEAKMETMSEAMSSMADSVAKLADLRYEMLTLRNDTTMLKSRVDKHDVSLDAIFSKYRELEKEHAKNTYVVGKMEVVMGVVAVGALNALFLFLKG